MSLSSGGARLHKLIVSLVPGKHSATRGPGLGRGRTGHSEGPEGPREERSEQWWYPGCTLNIFMPGFHLRPVHSESLGEEPGYHYF